MLEGNDPGGGEFALFLRPHPGAFRQFMWPHPGEFAHFFLKMLMPGVSPGGGWALLELTDALLPEKREELQLSCSSSYSQRRRETGCVLAVNEVTHRIRGSSVLLTVHLPSEMHFWVDTITDVVINVQLEKGTKKSHNILHVF